MNDEALRASILADLRSHNVDEALVDGDTRINIEFLATDLMDYARKFAASELRLAADMLDDDPFGIYPVATKSCGVCGLYKHHHTCDTMNDKIAATLRVRADELEGK